MREKVLTRYSQVGATRHKLFGLSAKADLAYLCTTQCSRKNNVDYPILTSRTQQTYYIQYITRTEKNQADYKKVKNCLTMQCNLTKILYGNGNVAVTFKKQKDRLLYGKYDG